MFMRIVRFARSANDVLICSGVGFAIDRRFYGTKAFRRRVTALTSRVRLFAVDFHKLRKINIVAE